MALNEEAVKKAEEQAALRKRMAAANSDILTPNQQFMQRRANFIRANPNAVSPSERNAVMTWDRNQDLTGREKAIQANEQAMLDKRNQGALDVAEANNKPAVLEAQGKYGYVTDGGESRLDKEYDMAQKRLEMERDRGKAQYGYFDDEGNYVGGSDFRRSELDSQRQAEQARLERESRERIEQSRADARRDVAETQAAMNKYKVDQSVAAKLVAIDRQLEGKDKAAKIAFIKECISTYQIPPAVAQQKIDELDNPGQGGTNPRDFSSWKRK